jgi:predicted exporter
MLDPLPSDPDLLKVVLAPLLDDFLYWFERSSQLLSGEVLAFMPPEAQQELLTKVNNAFQEVKVAQTLLVATDGQAGVEMAVLMNWHKLVAECWGVSMKRRSLNP